MATQVTIDQPTQAPGAPMEIHGLGRFLNGEPRKVTEEQIFQFMLNWGAGFETFEDAAKNIYGEVTIEEVPDEEVNEND